MLIEQKTQKIFNVLGIDFGNAEFVNLNSLESLDPSQRVDCLCWTSSAENEVCSHVSFLIGFLQLRNNIALLCFYRFSVVCLIDSLI